VEAGAHYVVTQLFYENSKYFEFVDMCKNAGITVPIIPGLKVLTHKAHLTNIPKNFYVNIPEELANEVLESKSEHVTEIGAKWAAKQVEGLLNEKVPGIHFYIMQSAKPIHKMFEYLKM